MEVRSVLLARTVLTARTAPGVLAQLVFHRPDPVSGVRTTFAAVHHSEVELRAPATYERVRPDAALLEPPEIVGEFTPGRGLRWVLPGGPGGRPWPTGVRLVRLVDGEAAARLLAAHFGVPLQVQRSDA